MNAMTPAHMRTVDRLREALAHAGSTHTVQDVIALARQGRAQFWQEGNTLVVTEVIDYPQRRVVRLWLAAGDLRDAEATLPRIEAWAKERGATMVEAVGRAGWRNSARERGFTATAVVYRKELDA
jgi:hypothetical protein